MRNNLTELPVLLACLWTGALAGGAAFLLRLPKTLYNRKHRGLRTPFIIKLLLAVPDILLCVIAAVLFSAGLLRVNGGELRLYAAAGFLFSLFGTAKLLKTLAL